MNTTFGMEYKDAVMTAAVVLAPYLQCKFKRP